MSEQSKIYTLESGENMHLRAYSLYSLFPLCRALLMLYHKYIYCVMLRLFISNEIIVTLSLLF